MILSRKSPSPEESNPVNELRLMLRHEAQPSHLKIRKRVIHFLQTSEEGRNICPSSAVSFHVVQRQQKSNYCALQALTYEII